MGPHCMNLALHMANTVLLFLFLRNATGAPWRSACVAALFAVHPLHVESVAWVSERKDVLSTFFGFLTLMAYVQHAGLEGSAQKVRAKKNVSNITALNLSSWNTFCLLLARASLFCFGTDEQANAGYTALSAGFAGLLASRAAFSSKPWAFEDFLARAARGEVAVFVLSAVACVATLLAQRGAIQTLDHLPLGERWANAAVAYAKYLQKCFWPSHLALPYLHPGHWPMAHVALSVAGIVLMSAAAVYAATKYPFVFTGWFWFLGTLVPTIGLVQVGAQSMADRYTYIPMAGIFIIAIWAAWEACARFKTATPVLATGGVALVSLCCAATHRQAGYWHDSERLFRHSAAVAEGNFVALANVGGALFKAGRLDDALEFYRQSFQINPHYAEAANSIGAVLAAKGSIDEAVEWFRTALTLQPGLADALFNMGNAMVKTGHSRAALDYFEAAVRANPENYEGRNNLANALTKFGRVDEAIVQYRAALADKPDEALIHRKPWGNAGLERKTRGSSGRIPASPGSNQRLGHPLCAWPRAGGAGQLAGSDRTVHPKLCDWAWPPPRPNIIWDMRCGSVAGSMKLPSI